MSTMDFLTWSAAVLFVVAVVGIVGLIVWAICVAVQAAGKPPR